MPEYIDEPGVLRSTRADRIIIDGESKVSRDAITPPIGDGGAAVEAHTPADGDTELAGLDIDGTDYEIVDDEARARLHTVEQRVHPIRQEIQTWADVTDGSAGLAGPAALITTVTPAAALTYDNAAKSGTESQFIYARIPIGGRQSEYRFQYTVGGGRQDGETFNLVLGTWPSYRIGVDSSWQYFQIGFYQGDTFSAGKLQRGTGDFVWEGGLTDDAVKDNLESLGVTTQLNAVTDITRDLHFDGAARLVKNTAAATAGVARVAIANSARQAIEAGTQNLDVQGVTFTATLANAHFGSTATTTDLPVIRLAQTEDRSDWRILFDDTVFLAGGWVPINVSNGDDGYDYYISSKVDRTKEIALYKSIEETTYHGELTKAAVYEQVKTILTGGVTDDDDSETIDIGGTSPGPQRPARPPHVRSVWGNDGVTNGAYADELALVEVASRDARASHAPYDYQYSSDQVSLHENDIALTGWHAVSASYDAANPGLVWDSDNNVFASNGVEFATVADRRIRVTFDLGLVGYLESGDTISLAVTTTGNLKAIPAHAGDDHAAVSAFFFTFDSSVHDHNAHLAFDLVFSQAPAATDTVALAITNNIIASRATAAPVVTFGVPQIDHIATQAYRGHEIGDRLTGGYWEHYRKEWPRQLRSPGAGESAAIADRQTAALVSHADESPYLIATVDVRAVVITARALGTGFNVSGDPVYVNIWTDIPGVMDPVRLGRTEVNARDFETNGVAGVAYGVRTGQRFFVTQGVASTLGYDIEVTWDANIVASRPAVTILQAGMLWSGTQAEYDAITTKDPNRLYLVEQRGLYLGTMMLFAAAGGLAPQALTAGTAVLQVGGSIPAGNSPGLEMSLDTEVQIPITALGMGNLASGLNSNNFTLKAGSYRIAVHLDEIWNTQDTANSIRNRSVVAMDIVGTLPDGTFHDVEPKYFRGANSTNKAQWDTEVTIYLPEDTEIGLALIGYPGIGEDTNANARNTNYHCVVGDIHIYPLG